jgi:N-glycosylase/DNA lyase
MPQLPDYLLENYDLHKDKIKKRLNEFSSVPEGNYFYELCYCIMTPQSKARSAYQAQKILEEQDFLHNDVDLIPILKNPEHYIRFHNQKAHRLKEAKQNLDLLLELLNTKLEPAVKRILVNNQVKGLGMKESAHFLRNIGYRNLGILDRHILKHLVNCGLYSSIPPINSRKQYEEVEKNFAIFANQVNIPMDELDLLFWSYETGEILK